MGIRSRIAKATRTAPPARALVPSTRKETVLYTFTGLRDGGNPEGGVLPNKSGKLIGTTCFGGANNKGTIFELDPKSRIETVLHGFDGANGSAPLGDLYQDGNGNFYGTSAYGGSSGYGVVFKLHP